MLKDLCFEIIQTCPNNCIFCSSCAGEDKKNIISFDAFKRTIDHLMSKGGIEEISISGGEPLLHPDLLRMIMYCKSFGIRVVLFTSGIKNKWKLSEEEIKLYEANLRRQYASYLDEGMSHDEYERLISKLMNRFIEYNGCKYGSLTSSDVRKLEDVGLDKIVFDFQAWNNDTYNKMMGTKNHYTLFLDSLAAAAVSSIPIDVHFIPTKINYKELPDLIEMLNVAGASQLSILNFVPQGRGCSNRELLEMSDKEFQEFCEILNREKDNFKGNLRVGIPLNSENTHRCTAGLSKMVIKYDGTVLPCPAFKEYDTQVLNSLGIKTPNIYTDLEDVSIRNGTMQKPLCKRLYNFQRSLV